MSSNVRNPNKAEYIPRLGDRMPCAGCGVWMVVVNLNPEEWANRDGTEHDCSKKV